MPRGLIHQLTVRHPTGSIRDGEGKWVELFASTQVRGRVTSPTETEMIFAAQTGLHVDAVAFLPLDTAIARNDRVTVAGTGRMNMDGDYEVRGIDPSVKHTTVSLKRWSIS